MKLVSEHPFGAGRLTARMHQLDNGLKVITVADPSAPVFAYQTWFAVGSRNERPGTTGIAHLFEHLMFNETESHPQGEFDRLLESAGGETNAATWVDWTYYRNSLPSSELELAVSLEAERMSRLVVRDRQVNSEREVVANERRFRVEDDVDGFLSEQLYKLAFTKHPYHWPTIGWMEDIFAITTEDAKTFYRTYYAPNNATLIIVGDIDETRALALVQERYGAIPSQTIPKDEAEPEPDQLGERRAVFEKPIHADKIQIAYRSPAMPDADFPVMEVLSDLLVGGNSSRLHRKLVVDTEIASGVQASAAPFKDPGLFEITISLQRGHVAKEAEDIVYAELERLAREPVPEETLAMIRTRLRTRFFSDLRTAAGKAEALGHFQTTGGDYRRLFQIADAYRAVTADDILRVTKARFTADKRTVVLATPSGDGAGADDDELDEGGEE